MVCQYPLCSDVEKCDKDECAKSKENTETEETDEPISPSCDQKEGKISEPVKEESENITKFQPSK